MYNTYINTYIQTYSYICTNIFNYMLGPTKWNSRPAVQTRLRRRRTPAALDEA